MGVRSGTSILELDLHKPVTATSIVPAPSPSLLGCYLYTNTYVGCPSQQLRKVLIGEGGILNFSTNENARISGYKFISMTYKLHTGSFGSFSKIVRIRRDENARNKLGAGGWRVCFVVDGMSG